MTNSLVLGLLARQTYTPAWWLLVSLITRFVARTTTSVEIDFPSAQRGAEQRTTGQWKIKQRQTALRKVRVISQAFSCLRNSGEERGSTLSRCGCDLKSYQCTKRSLCGFSVGVHWGLEHSLVALESSQNVKFTSFKKKNLVCPSVQCHGVTILKIFSEHRQMWC